MMANKHVHIHLHAKRSTFTDAQPHDPANGQFASSEQGAAYHKVQAAEHAKHFERHEKKSNDLLNERRPQHAAAAAAHKAAHEKHVEAQNLFAGNKMFARSVSKHAHELGVKAHSLSEKV